MERSAARHEMLRERKVLLVDLGKLFRASKSYSALGETVRPKYGATAGTPVRSRWLHITQFTLDLSQDSGENGITHQTRIFTPRSQNQEISHEGCPFIQYGRLEAEKFGASPFRKPLFPLRFGSGVAGSALCRLSIVLSSRCHRM